METICVSVNALLPISTTGKSSITAGITTSVAFPVYFLMITPSPSLVKSYSKSEAGFAVCASCAVAPTIPAKENMQIILKTEIYLFIMIPLSMYGIYAKFRLEFRVS